MKGKNIVVFSFDDIRREVCKEMEIKEEHFRDYHRVVGGEHKDLWHEWMRYFDPNLVKGCIASNDPVGEIKKSKKSWMKEDGKEWLFPFVDAVYKVFDDNQIEHIKYY